jgi:RsiW-degrading membrane proteinase PrsW (M82 family)
MFSMKEGKTQEKGFMFSRVFLFKLKEAFYIIKSFASDMNLIFNFNQNWYVLFSAFIVSWALLMFVRRKRQTRKEVKEQVFLAFGGMLSLALMELFAVSMNLWHYTPGDWPVILWPTYFVAILFGYQMLRSIEGLLHKPLLHSKIP